MSQEIYSSQVYIYSKQETDRLPAKALWRRIPLERFTIAKSVDRLMFQKKQSYTLQ